jgi:hypothetical protein
MNPLGWLENYKEFKLEWQSHSSLTTAKRDVSIIVLTPRMISMQIAKLGIVTNPLCSMDDVQANCKVGCNLYQHGLHNILAYA